MKRVISDDLESFGKNGKSAENQVPDPFEDAIGKNGRNAEITKPSSASPS